MDNQIIGKRLKKLREKAGIKLGEASRTLGFNSYQILSNIESGMRVVSVLELKKFCELYFCDINDILEEKSNENEMEFLFREVNTESLKKACLNQKLAEICKIYQFVENHLIKSNSVQLYKADKNEISNIDNIEHLSDKISKILELGIRPANSLIDILEQKYNIKIIYVPLNNYASAACFVSEDNDKFILINSNDCEGRRNFDVAHELFHIITWNLFSKNEYEDLKISKLIETKANQFAASLLMPSKEIKNEIQNRIHSNKKLYSNDFIDIAKDFKVSTSALLFRMLNLNIIDTKQFSKFKKDIELMERKLNNKNNLLNYTNKYLSLHISALRKGLISRGLFSKLFDIERSDIDFFINSKGYVCEEDEEIKINFN